MSSPPSNKSIPAVGFFTVHEHAELGLFGGYLVLNAVGRPLEFHCTAPVKPNRAQEILYGPTLKPFLYGEQIGQALIEKSKIAPLLICTDIEPGLAVRETATCPVVLLLSDAVSATSHLARFQLGDHAAAVSDAFAADEPLAQERWKPYANKFDLREPFGRIREALEEAQRTARAAA